MNEKDIRDLENEFSIGSDAIFREALESVYVDTIKQHKKKLSLVIVGNEITKRTTQFNIPLHDEYVIEKHGDIHSLIFSFTTMDKIGDLILLAAWHGTGLSVNPEMLKYVQLFGGDKFKEIQPPTQEADENPDSLSTTYFVPTYADTIFKDALVNNASDFEISIEVKEA